MPAPTDLPDDFPSPPPRPSRFGALWRFFLPVAIAMIGAAVLTGIFDDTGRPAWLFAGGVAIALIGVASLLRSLFDQGRADIRAAEDRLAARLHPTQRKDTR
jgi:hypothetical protein